MTLATPNQQKKARPPQTLGIGPQTLKNFRLGSGVVLAVQASVVDEMLSARLNLMKRK